MRRPLIVAGTVLGVCVGLLFVDPVAGAVTASSPVTVTRDIVYSAAGGEPVTLDAYVPTAKTARRPVIVLVHGGAWVGGDKSDLAVEGGRLAALGYVAFSVNYRLAPAHPYPAAVDDVQAAVRWVRAPAQIKKYAIDPKRIGALGASAGGHLVSMLATLGSGSLAQGARIKAAVSWSGPMDFELWPPTLIGGSPVGLAVLSFLDCAPSDATCANAAAASPVSYVDKTDAAMLIANSDRELVALNQATTMDSALKAAGVVEQLVVLPGTRHAQGYRDDIWAQTVAFLEQNVRKPPTAKN